ncbi:DUF6297 family protein [Rhizohabitans arisaemae]|uniref:DUF6297 family protein n=1 Tax=Rhizohabitans arisaemae TaxID=2720610 RepID=UPI0024B05F75|nr:DUF6297 family protein [Rhizohabitans arisaemae]
MNPARAYLRSRGRLPKTWSDRYATLFGLVLVIALAGQPIEAALSGLAGRADPSRLGAGLALIFAGYAGFLVLARTLGPVALPAADAAWLVLSPLSRRSTLTRTAVVLFAVSTVGGLALGVALLAVVGAPDHLTLRVAAALVVGVATAIGGMATAVLGQASPAWDHWVQAVVAGTLVAAVLSAALGGGPGRSTLTAVASAPSAWVGAVAGTAVVTAAVSAWRAWIALDRIPAQRLLRSSSRWGRLNTAVTLLDPGALTWAAEENRWRGRVLRSRRWPRLVTGRWAGEQALAWQEWRRVGRRPLRLAVLFGTAALPAFAVQAGLSAVAAVVLLGGALAAAVACTAGIRRDADDPTLTRLLAVDPRAALAARAVLPVLVAALWLALGLTGLMSVGALPVGVWWLLAPAVAPALAAGAMRMARRRPLDHSMPVIDMGAGAIPAGPLIWALTGVDLALPAGFPALTALVERPADPRSLIVTQALVGAVVLVAYLLRAASRRS